MKIIIILLLLNFSLLGAGSTNSTEKSAGSSGVAATNQDKQEQPAFLKVSDVPESAAQANIEINTIKEHLKEEKEQTRGMQEEIDPYCDSISLLLENPNYQNIGDQDVRELQKMQSELTLYLKQLEGWKRSLKSSIEKYDENRKVLKDDSALWKQTHVNAVNEKAPDVILEHITSVIAEIDALEKDLKNEYDKVLTGSQKITTAITTIKEVGVALKKSEAVVKTQVFYRDKASLSELYTQNKVSFPAYLSSIKRITVEKYHEGIGYFQAHTDRFPVFAAVILLIAMFVAYFNYLYRKKKLFVREESFRKKAFFFIGRPFSTFFILFVLAIVAIFPDSSDSVKEMQLLFIVIPVTRILQTAISRESLKYLYLFFVLYILFILNKNITDYELENRLFMLLITVTLFIYLLYIIINKVLYSVNYNFIARMGTYILALYSLLLLIAVFANLTGSVSLSLRILDGIFETIYASVAFYTLYIILTGYVVIILRRRISTASNMLDKYSKNIENTTRILIKIWMLSWWFLIVIEVLGIYPYLIAFKDNVLAFSWQIAETTISVQSIADFMIIVVGTWLLAFLIRTVLEVEIFARFTLPRGVPTAITTVLNYGIVISGTVLAFSSLGVTAQQFALIFGALGVGIGFGLRNIIANFVSGIIMVFERPVQIGDFIEVDNTKGTVQSIGSRSSTIKTVDGSEVIIPNADFIAKEIINWTLSDKHRRKVVEFKVDFDSDIEQILAIMKEVALSHPDVLKDPAPLAVFQGFGDYYLEFKLYFWLSTNLIIAPSDVSIGVYKALKNAGVKMPVEKREMKGEKAII